MTLTKWTLGNGQQWASDGPWTWNSVATPWQDYFQEYFQAVKLTDSLGVVVWFEPTATADDGTPSHLYEWTGYTIKARTVALDSSLAMGPILTLFTNSSTTDFDAPEGFTVERLTDDYCVVGWGMYDFVSHNTEGGLILIGRTGSTLSVVDTEMMASGFRTAWPSAFIAKSPTQPEFYLHYNYSGSTNTATYERVTYGVGGLTRNASASIAMLADGPVDGYWDVESLHVTSDGRVWAFQTGSMTLGGTLVTAYTEITLDGSRNPTGSSGTRTIIPALSGSWWTAQNASKSTAPPGSDHDHLWAFGSDVGLVTFQMGAGRIVYSAGAWTVTDFTAFEMPAWPDATDTVLQGYGSSTTFGIYQIYYASVSYPWSLTIAPGGNIAWAGPIHFPSASGVLGGARVNACWVLVGANQGYVFQDNVIDGLTPYQTVNDYGVGHPSIGGSYGADTSTSGAYSNTAVIATDSGAVFFQSMDTWYKTDGSGDRVLSLGYVHWVSEVRMRAHYNRAIMDREGNLIPGCTVRVIDPADGVTNLTDQIFVSQSGSATRSNPYVCDDGILDFYLAQERRVRLGITKPGTTTEVVFDGSDVLSPPGAPAVPPGT